MSDEILGTAISESRPDPDHPGEFITDILVHGPGCTDGGPIAELAAAAKRAEHVPELVSALQQISMGIQQHCEISPPNVVLDPLLMRNWLLSLKGIADATLARVQRAGFEPASNAASSSPAACVPSS